MGRQPRPRPAAHPLAARRRASSGGTSASACSSSSRGRSSPGSGCSGALLATVVGAVLGCALLGLAGLIGFERRVPAMVLLRDPLGVRGSYVPTALNVAQNLGWAVFELYVMSLAASALSERGLRRRRSAGSGCSPSPALTLWLALAGPISFVRRCVRRFAIWVVARLDRPTSSGGRSTAPTSGALWSAGRRRRARASGRAST